MCLKLLLLDVMEKMGTSLLSMHSAYEEAVKLSKKYNGNHVRQMNSSPSMHAIAVPTQASCTRRHWT